jgi:CRISPR-associated protein Cas2
MWVIDLEAPPPHVRGLLSRWAVEVRAGLYVGSSTAKTRDAIWDRVVAEMGLLANAVLIHDARSAQGFEIRTAGPNRRKIVDVDGLWLAQFVAPSVAAPRPASEGPPELVQEEDESGPDERYLDDEG